MSETTADIRPNTPRKKAWLRVLACVLAVIMLLSVFILDAVRIKLRSDVNSDTTKAAVDTLSEDSAYMEGTTTERLSQWLRSTLSSPETFEDYYQIATILIAQGEYKRALTNMTESIRLYTGGDPAIVDELYMKQGGLYAMLGEYTAMEESFSHVSDDNAYQPQKLLLIAQAAIETGDTGKAIENLTAYLKLQPDERELTLTLAQLYAVTGQFEDAAGIYSRLMDVYDDASGTLVFLRGSCYMEMQEYALGLTDFLAALEMGYADTSLCLAQCSLCSFLCDRYEDCLSYGMRALEKPSAEVSEPDLKYYMGLAAMTLGDYETARDHFVRSAELDETHLDSAYYAAVCIMALGSNDEAAKRFTELIEKGYGLELCYYNRAVCYIQQRQYALAKTDLEKIVSTGEDKELLAMAEELLKQMK